MVVCSSLAFRALPLRLSGSAATTRQVLPLTDRGRLQAQRLGLEFELVTFATGRLTREDDPVARGETETGNAVAGGIGAAQSLVHVAAGEAEESGHKLQIPALFIIDDAVFEGHTAERGEVTAMESGRFLT